MAKKHPSRSTDGDGFELSSSRFPDGESRALWLMEFLRLDLGTLDVPRSAETQQAAWEFATSRGALVERDDDLDAANRPRHSALVRLQDEIKHGIQRVRSGEWWELTEPVSYGIARMGGKLIGGPQRGLLRSLFVQTAMDIIKEEWARLRACPHCARMFIRLGKQAYCSPGCSQKERWNRFKVGRAPRDFHAERQNALRKRHGAQIRVGRNKRPTTSR